MSSYMIEQVSETRGTFDCNVSRPVMEAGGGMHVAVWLGWFCSSYAKIVGSKQLLFAGAIVGVRVLYAGSLGA